MHGDLHDGDGMGFVSMATCVLQVEAQELVLFKLKPLLEIGQGTLQRTFLVGVDHPLHGVAVDRRLKTSVVGRPSSMASLRCELYGFGRRVAEDDERKEWD